MCTPGPHFFASHSLLNFLTCTVTALVKITQHLHLAKFIGSILSSDLIWAFSSLWLSWYAFLIEPFLHLMVSPGFPPPSLAALLQCPLLKAPPIPVKGRLAQHLDPILVLYLDSHPNLCDLVLWSIALFTWQYFWNVWLSILPFHRSFY